MVSFQIVVSDPETGKAKSIELKDEKCRPLIGKKIGDIIDGALIGMPGYKLQITGGTDVDGFPMKPGVSGARKVSILMSRGVGMRPRKKRKGLRLRKTVRGEVISEFIRQINMKIVEKPKKKKKEKEKKAEKS